MRGANVPVFGTNVPVFGENVPVFGTNVPVFGENVPVFGTNVPVFGTNVLVFGTNIPVFGTNVLVFGTNIPVFGTNVPGRSSLQLGDYCNPPIHCQTKIIHTRCTQQFVGNVIFFTNLFYFVISVLQYKTHFQRHELLSETWTTVRDID